jgi:hypothetical protein
MQNGKKKRLFNQNNKPFQKTPLDWKKHLQDSNFVNDALSFEKWDKNLEFDTAKFFQEVLKEILYFFSQCVGK